MHPIMFCIVTVRGDVWWFTGCDVWWLTSNVQRWLKNGTESKE